MSKCKLPLGAADEYSWVALTGHPHPARTDGAPGQGVWVGMGVGMDVGSPGHHPSPQRAAVLVKVSVCVAEVSVGECRGKLPVSHLTNMDGLEGNKALTEHCAYS